tara:strand:+ start:112 stop:372 length:261 start_codon:yes stop_codon:yes gene_type:complete
MDEYYIELKERQTFSKVTSLAIYLVPKNVQIHRDSIFKIKLGYVDLEDNNTFHCIDSDRMTLDIMKSITSSWEQWNIDRNRDSAPF